MEKPEYTVVLEKLILHLEKTNYKGYDPYDALKSPLPWEKMGKWAPVIAIQIFKRLPFNIRPFFGIAKEHNPKAMGLFLYAFSNLYLKTGNIYYKKKAEYFFNWLINNYSKGYSGICWGYNFPWASSVKFVPAYSPTSVVTGFVCKGIFRYYQATQNENAREYLISAANFILKDIPVFRDNSGICFSYSIIEKDICYNASMLAVEVLAFANYFLKDPLISEKIELASEFVSSRQKADGSWYYSENPISGKERKQIDFHQGYIIDSFKTVQNLTGSKKYEIQIQKGLQFYFSQQFFETGQAKYRLPSEFPVDIHHVAQGIITFSRISPNDKHLTDFANKITNWAITNMHSPKGYFYYRKEKILINKLDYVRWAQAWMMLALSELT
jgi:hypothetical protein